MLLKPVRACSTFACKALTRVWRVIPEPLEDVVGIKYHLKKTDTNQTYLH